MQTMRNTLEYTALTGIPLSNSSPQSSGEESWGGGSAKSKSVGVRGVGGHQENRVLWKSMSKAHVNSQPLRRHAEGLRRSAQARCIHIIKASGLVFLRDSYMCKHIDFCFLCLLLGSFPSLCFVNLPSVSLYLFYFILTYWLLENGLFSNGRQKGSGSKWEV